MEITKEIIHVGVNDREIDLFEGQYPVPFGIAYNSYIIKDEKIAVMDSVDVRFSDLWIKNIKNVIGERAPDYLIIQHMEPDHASGILKFLECFPYATIVSSSKAFNIMKGFFDNEFLEGRTVVGEGDVLSLGRHKLRFFTAPMVHWPEVIMSYDECDKVFFSADAFGKFGALDVDDAWEKEARRYYFGIVGKYGAQVQTLLKKVKSLDIKAICSLHGPVLKENISHYLSLYDTWSSYKAEVSGVWFAYTSIYGNTKEAVEHLESLLKEKGVEVNNYDLARSDIFCAVADAFRYDKLILATTTYNGDIFPFMKAFIHHLTERNYQNRTVGFIENGSWAPMATKVMKNMLEKSKNLAYLNTEVRINSAIKSDSEESILNMAKEIIN